MGSVTPPPRGATPTRDPAKVHARLCEKVQQLSSTTAAATTTQQPEYASSVQPPPLSQSLSKAAPQGTRECCQRLRPDSVPAYLSEGSRSRCIVTDGRQRRALIKSQQVTSAENRASACLTSAHSIGGFPAKASGILQPRSEEAGVNRGPDSVIASEMLVRCHSPLLSSLSKTH